MFVRAILLAIVVLLVIAAARSVRRKIDQFGQRETRVLQDKTVQCAHCGVYVPLADAVVRGEKSFCSEEHARSSGL